MSSTSPGPSSTGGHHARFAKACERCRHQKLACKPGSRGEYPCLRCEDTKSKCILVERTRPTPIPTLSSKLSKQEDTLESLSSQINEMQRRLSTLTDVQIRLGNLEAKFRTLESATPTGHFDHPTNSTIDANRTLNDSGKDNVGVVMTSAQEHTVNDDIAVVHDFENSDINATRLLSDARLYRRTTSRLGKRIRIEDEEDALRIAFTIFTMRCLPSVNFFNQYEPDFTAESVQQRSQLLYWSIITIGAREISELYDLYVKALEKTMELLRQTLGGKKPTYWDVCGAMVWNKWLAPIRPIGHIVDLAYELDIHRTYDLMSDRDNPTAIEVSRIRLWVAILVQDYFYSTATGRPPHYPHRDRAWNQAKWLVTTRYAVRNDWRILSTYDFEEITREIQEEAGQNVTLKEGWEALVEKNITALNEWYARWEPVASSRADPNDINPMLSSVKANWYFAKLAVYSVVLRGIRSVQELTPARLTYVALSVATAREECQICVTEFQSPAIQYLGESQLYGFVSAVVFLLKVIWLLPNMEEAHQIFTELERVIKTMEAISGQMHAHFLSQILRHVKSKVEKQQGQPKATDDRDRERPRLDGFAVPNIINNDVPITDFSTVPPVVSGSHMGTNGIFGSNGVNAVNGVNGATLSFGDIFDTGHSSDDFWSWLQVDGQEFNPLVDTLDTFDSSIPMGGL